MYAWIVAEKIPSISEETRQKWEIQNETTTSQIKFYLPTNFSELFPAQHEDIIAYQIYVLGKSSNEGVRDSKY